MARPHGLVCIIIIKVSSGAIIATVAHRTCLVGCEFRQQSSSTLFVAAHLKRRRQRMVRDPVTCMPTWIPSAFSGCLCQSAVGSLHPEIRGTWQELSCLPASTHIRRKAPLVCLTKITRSLGTRWQQPNYIPHTHHLMGMKKYSRRTCSRKHICVLVRLPRTFLLLLLHGQRSLDDELYFIKLWSILIAINFDFQFNL